MSKVVLITGASSGIGAATAHQFASLGYHVVINYFHGQARAQTLAQTLTTQYPIKTLCLQADISNEEAVSNMINTIIATFDRIDVLVNNAGIAIDSDYSTKTVADFQTIINTNLIGTFIVTKHVAKHMQTKQQGTIINVGSTNGINSYYPYSMEYDATKAAIHILTKDLAVELAPYIRVNAVAPGWVNTPMNHDLDSNFIQTEQQKIALNRFAEPSEIAKVISFLASADASYINGAIIVVDGGRK